MINLYIMAEENPEQVIDDAEQEAAQQFGRPDDTPAGQAEANIPLQKDDGQTKKKPEDCIPETLSGEELPPDESDRIIASMLNILQECQKKVDEQKIDSHSLVFMLLRIKESLDAYYNSYFQKINSFLVQAEKITADYYRHIGCSLPQYGDYVNAIENEKSEQIDAGAWPHDKHELLNLTRTVTDNYYAVGTFINSYRMLLKDIHNCQSERSDIVNKMVRPLPKWMEFQDKVTTQLDLIREQTFKISAYVDFLKQGEMKMAPTLDLTVLNKTTDSPDTSKRMDGN